MFFTKKANIANAQESKNSDLPIKHLFQIMSQLKGLNHIKDFYTQTFRYLKEL